MRKALSPYAFTEERRLKWVREGRGTGEGAAYVPWLKVSNVKSRGRKHRLPGALHDRVMHLMSDLERNAVVFFERQPQVVDIREQFPLDREVTRAIAKAMGVRHPADPQTGVDIVMTTDLVVSYVTTSGRMATRPLSVKESSDLLKQRTQQKQEIERRFWRRYGETLRPLLDCQLRDTDLINALLWAREWFDPPVVRDRVALRWPEKCRAVLAALAEASAGELGDLVARAERREVFAPGEALSVLRHLIARQRVDYAFADGTPTLATPVASFALRIAPALRIAA